MAHHDHNHRNVRREMYVPTPASAFVTLMRRLSEQDAANTSPEAAVSSVGVWTLSQDPGGHLTATYGPTGDAFTLVQAPVPPPPGTIRAAVSAGARTAGQGDASPALLALIGGLPTSLPTT